MMYRDKTIKSIIRRRRIRYYGIFVLLLALLLAWFGYQALEVQFHEQGAVSVREAVLNSARQCCAIEGSFPSSLQYLEDNYGLRINHNDYIVTYEAFASNLSPSVVVVPR